MKIIISIPLLLLFICYCSKQDDQNEKIALIKKIEIHRGNRLESWTGIYNDPNYSNLRPVIIRAMGHTRNPDYLDFYEKRLSSQPDDTLLNRLLTAVGMIGSPEANSTLLSLDYNSLKRSNKKELINALSYFPEKRVLKFYNELLSSDDLSDVLYINLAKLARDKYFSTSARRAILDSASLEKPTFAKAYYLTYAVRGRDINALIKMITHADGETLRLLFKSLALALDRYKIDVTESLSGDSLLQLRFSEVYDRILSKNYEEWRTQRYALQCFPAIGDSLLISKVQMLTSAPNPHIRIAANEALINLDNSNQSLLLKNLSTEKSWFVKSSLIDLLAKISPKIAYLIIQENLANGDDYFKAKLLTVLGKIKTRASRVSLRTYLQVPNSLLAKTAFTVLDGRKALQLMDAEQMLARDEGSSLSLVVDWYSHSKFNLDPQLLVKLFARSVSVENYDLQLSVLKSFKRKKTQIMSNDQNLLWNRACFYQIKDSLLKMFPELQKKYAQAPAFLLPDSIDFRNAPDVLIRTVKGSIRIQLYPQLAPITVHYFTDLVKNNFYDGLLFHRVVPDFVIQGGDPNGDGWGGPGYFIPSEDNTRPFIRGSVGIATSGFDTGGSQFFICQSAQPHLTGNYTLFGQVIEGMETVDMIEPGDKIIKIELLSD